MDNQKDDIEKYLKGELSPAEMHKLEMQALHDPFLADALEGADTITSNQFIEDINVLNQKIQSTKTKRYYWPLRIAASILLIVSITYLVFQVKPENSNESLALNKEEKNDADKTEEITNKDIDSTEKIKGDILESKKNNLILKSEDKPITKPKGVPKQIVENSQAPIPSSGALEETVTSTPRDELEETSDDVVPVTQDLSILENEKVSEFKTETRRMRSDALKKSSPASTLSGISSEERQSRPKTFVTAQPVIGNEEYQTYLKNNIQYPKKAIDNKISGDVVISFIVDVDGSISSFSIDKDIGFDCAEELIRTVKSGPEWTPAQNDGLSMKEKVSLKFNFELPN
ncbi:MAG: energy transducer TonB [Cyclobacteriaceae bacterium]